ncbi:type VII secretion target [Mycolicibacterium houstonense]|uniref:type VII secretion target n=1 Tax=Mycolicibacterium houstonense TaxID=146021 RepID=UPI00082B6F21|nr:type VII secretion target [Mycolicibacterium houstonense]
MNQLVADSGAITGLQGIVGSVSEEMSTFKDAFSGPSDLASTQGTIGFPVQNAYGGAMSARDGALGATQVAAGRMAELLGMASQAYARGDTAAGEQLKAQADALGGGSAPASAAGGGSDASEAASSGAGGAGQMVGQFSQMAGQMAQSITQPLQGLTQAMTQVPQQVMQGVQGIVEAATQAAGDGGDAAATAAETGRAGAEDAVKAADQQDGKPDSQHDGRDDKKDDAEPREHDRDRTSPGEAGTAAERGYEQLGNRASAGAAAEDGFGVGPVPTQVHNINPRRQ